MIKRKGSVLSRKIQKHGIFSGLAGYRKKEHVRTQEHTHDTNVRPVHIQTGIIYFLEGYFRANVTLRVIKRKSQLC